MIYRRMGNNCNSQIIAFCVLGGETQLLKCKILVNTWIEQLPFCSSCEIPYFKPRLPTATHTGLPAREVDAANKAVEESQIVSGSASKKPRKYTIFRLSHDWMVCSRAWQYSSKRNIGESTARFLKST